MSLLAGVEKTIKVNQLVEPGDGILVALSGGPDSVALLHTLSQLRKSHHLSIEAVYVNHGIRRQAATKEERFCAKLCKQLEIPLTIERANIPAMAKRERIGLEEAGRVFRYQLFDQLCGEHGLTKIATGHHLDDRVETIIFRILRGTGRTGLAGIPVRRGRIIRPLYDVSRAQILAYLKEQKLGYCTDQSNTKTEHTRNYLRNRLLPEIRKRLNPQVDRALLNLGETISDEEAVLDGQVRRAVGRTVRVTSGGKIELDGAKIRGYTTWLRRRLLRHCLGSISEGVSLDRETVERLDSHILLHKGNLSLPGRIQAVFAGSQIVLVASPPIQYERELVEGETVWLTQPNLQISSRRGKKPSGSPRQSRRANRVTVDYDKLQFPLVVRSIRPGDRFQPLGMRGRKKVGDYLTDRKVPKVYRDEIPVIADSVGIVWVVGYEIADRIKVDTSTRKVLTLAVNNAKRAIAPAV